MSLNKRRKNPTNLSQRKTFQVRPALFPRGELLLGVPFVLDWEILLHSVCRLQIGPGKRMESRYMESYQKVLEIDSAAVGAGGILREWTAGGGQSCGLFLSNVSCCHCCRQNSRRTAGLTPQSISYVYIQLISPQKTVKWKHCSIITSKVTRREQNLSIHKKLLIHNLSNNTYFHFCQHRWAERQNISSQTYADFAFLILCYKEVWVSIWCCNSVNDVQNKIHCLTIFL